MPADRSESTEDAEFRSEVRAWLTENTPAAPDFKLPQTFLEVESDAQFDFLQRWQQRVYEAGYLGLDVPKEYGGQGVDLARKRIVSQEMGRARAPFMVNVIGLHWAGPTILKFGTEEQKKRCLPGLLSGDEIWCQGFSEPEFGSDLGALQARAVRDGDDYVVNGHKVWTTLAHKARWMILLARTDPEAHKYAGLSYFLFPMQSEGVTVQPLVKMTGEGGFNQVMFEDARCPHSALLGAEGQGWNLALTTLMFERGQGEQGAADVGGATTEVVQKLVDTARAGRRDGQPAIDDPLIRDRLTQVWIDATAAHFNARRGRVKGLTTTRPMAGRMMSKLLASELNHRIQRLACDSLGGEQRLWLGDPDAPFEAEWVRGLMNSYGITIGGGTSEIQRNILGERVLGLPKSK